MNNPFITRWWRCEKRIHNTDHRKTILKEMWLSLAFLIKIYNVLAWQKLTNGQVVRFFSPVGSADQHNLAFLLTFIESSQWIKWKVCYTLKCYFFASSNQYFCWESNKKILSYSPPCSFMVFRAISAAGTLYISYWICSNWKITQLPRRLVANVTLFIGTHPQKKFCLVYLLSLICMAIKEDGSWWDTLRHIYISTQK